MRVLFITSNRLGDAVLSTGLLNHIVQAHPDAEVTVVCGSLPASLFEGVPGLERIIILQKRSWNRHWLRLWRQVAGQRWDMVVDLRDSAVSRLIRADKKYIHTKRAYQKPHKVEQNAEIMGLEPPPAPTLWPTAGQLAQAARLIPAGGPVLGIGPTANWLAKTWPAENFIALIARLTAPDGPLPGAHVAVFAAPGEEEAARRVLTSVPATRQLDLIAKTDSGTAAAALARCALYIGNDSGLMHCAAAAGVATLGLFGPSWPQIYRPWGEAAAYVSTPQDFVELTAYEDYDPRTAPSLMASLSVETVTEAATTLMNR